MKLAEELDTIKAGARMAGVLRKGDVVTLSGPLSAGKTTFVRGLLAALGHEGEVPSPTFAIVQPYEALELPLWHVDLYRIEDREELRELGLDELGDQGVLVVEWPERAGIGAWPEALALSLHIAPDDGRALTAKVPASWEGRWPPR
ncbi:MAG: tRNA (adenosine(37)-N6)-threonylcarbamoyltransferase complex ATPase subunit type 1 TsaE [Sphingomonas sp.]|uniref:tRNA (adenosine(37)-N6)-threonylcarbamoyltransferase complex ATPase subunit type 1 TsaE n=1 Tax=Sphingomonas sp. TaxID=28214 RepID=UPI0017ECCBF7|nr:tRNA (adenosine(37)-N6)-threonylcarbamoyltransferase complex ATPase subunit type 1 TsaE [Sphingomonas sp.]MBA3666203.1 tRNA (adenosine(37)-N6)-threonylcarbamoyltransferase complex ATPase subunit type 1 TsaE [Sphingomonas sp.]